ncbi:MAG: hypothetical protein GEV06_28455, partial [Luteitalea sp.]|nr:hypothetical protein [Luteitalea sp.]
MIPAPADPQTPRAVEQLVEKFYTDEGEDLCGGRMRHCIVCEKGWQTGGSFASGPRHHLPCPVAELAAALQAQPGAAQALTQEDLADSWCPHCGRVGGCAPGCDYKRHAVAQAAPSGEVCACGHHRDVHFWTLVKREPKGRPDCNHCACEEFRPDEGRSRVFRAQQNPQAPPPLAPEPRIAEVAKDIDFAIDVTLPRETQLRRYEEILSGAFVSVLASQGYQPHEALIAAATAYAEDHPCAAEGCDTDFPEQPHRWC